MKVVFLDIEANSYGGERESVQIGAIKCDYNTGETAYFDEYIKPTIFEKMSKHCLEVTGITDQLLEKKGKDIREVLTNLEKFVEDTVVISWDEFDYLQLRNEFSRNKMKFMFDKKEKNIKYFNFQKIYQLKNSILRKPSLMKTIKELGLKHNEDNVHSALTDSFNLKILFDATNSIYNIEKIANYEKALNVDQFGDVISKNEKVFNIHAIQKIPSEIKQILLNSVITVEKEGQAEEMISMFNKMNIWDEVYIKNY